MTAISAYRQHEARGDSSNICFPAALDAMLPKSELPDKYYDFFANAFTDPDVTFNGSISFILRNFFNVEPMPDTDLAAVAEFNAFDASPQDYMPDAPYDFPDMGKYFEEGGVTPQQMRLVALLEIARKNGCNVLFTNNAGHAGEHVSGLKMIDPGRDSWSAGYVIREKSRLTNLIYSASELAGIPQTLGNSAVTDFTPLPAVERPDFPEGQRSWELIILPPDPGL